MSKIFLYLFGLFFITTKSFAFNSISEVKIYDSIKNYNNETNKVINSTSKPYPTRSTHKLIERNTENKYNISNLYAITDIDWETGNDKILAVRLSGKNVLESNSLTGYNNRREDSCSRKATDFLSIFKNENLDLTFKPLLSFISKDKNKGPSNLLTSFRVYEINQAEYQIPVENIVNGEKIQTTIDGILQVRCMFIYRPIGEQIKKTGIQFKEPVLVGQFQLTYGTKEYFDRYNAFNTILPEKNIGSFFERLSDETAANSINYNKKNYTGLKFEYSGRTRTIAKTGQRLKSPFIMCYYKADNYVDGKVTPFRGTDLTYVYGLGIMVVDSRDCVDPYIYNHSFYNSTHQN